MKKNISNYVPMAFLMLLFWATASYAQTHVFPYQIGDSVRVNPDSSYYMTGEKISPWVYQVNHAIKQIDSEYHPEGVLLYGIESWVYKTAILPADYVKALEDKAKTNPNYYRVYTLGEYVTLDRLVYYNWRVEDFEHKDIKGQLIIGMDFGFINDVSAIVASILVEDEKKIYVFREWGDTGKTNQELAQVIKMLGFSKSVIVADSAEKKSIEEIKREGIPKIRPCSKKGRIIDGIQKLQEYQIILHPSCIGLKTELENYTWKKDKATGEYTNEPIDLYNHYCDSLRYSIQAATTRVKIMDKNSF
jgi:phage terminase large subunit